ncbi:hypothetical protein [Mesorhizobium erdmanii]|nr:hypothetical protein [Mesorhizobium erdmanii]
MANSGDFLRTSIESRRTLYTRYCQADSVTLSFAYMKEEDAVMALSERDISSVICSVSTVYPNALPANTFNAGLNWFIAFPSNTSARSTW